MSLAQDASINCSLNDKKFKSQRFTERDRPEVSVSQPRDINEPPQATSSTLSVDESIISTVASYDGQRNQSVNSRLVQYIFCIRSVSILFN